MSTITFTDRTANELRVVLAEAEHIAATDPAPDLRLRALGRAEAVRLLAANLQLDLGDQIRGPHPTAAWDRCTELADNLGICS